MKRILLEITGIQQMDGDSDKIELTTVGTIRDDGSAYIIKYNEEQEPPTASVQVNLRIAKDGSYVNLTRSGAINSCLLIERSTRNQCQYPTLFGNFLMGIYGRDIEAKVEDGGGSFTFSYDIDFNGALASKNTVNIKFTNNQEH